MSDSPDDRSALRHALRDRARESARRDRGKLRRHFAQRAVAAIVALSIVWLVLQGFSGFLAAFQKVMEIEAADPAPAPTAPVPVYIVEQPMPAVAAGPPTRAEGTSQASP